jgi:hypothetical protein
MKSVVENHRDINPASDNIQMQQSIIEWVSIFDSVVRKPQTIEELIKSPIFYLILMEIEPQWFPSLPPALLQKDLN